MTSFLRLEGITKRWGDFTALGNVNLEVEEGEFVTFLGPSGSGKTTTLMIIAGFEDATRGQVMVNGRDIAKLDPHERNIGIVFQNYALFPHRTAVENVYFPLQMRGVKRAEGLARAEEMLEIVGLKGFGHRYPKEMSGGQQQRVALARALVFKPSLLLLDEPLGALDKNLREQMQIEIKRIQKTLGVTTIFVTHDQTEAMSMSDRIVVFNKGEIEQAATPLEIYHQPETRFVADFIGESNLIEVTVTDAATGTVQAADFGNIRLDPDARLTNGQTLAVMIRPEHIKLSRLPKDGWQTAAMVIDTIVNYGDNALVLGMVGETPVRVRVLGADVVILKEGEACTINWQASHVTPVLK
ncbi:ABC transporter ATP-binding protein [Gemmobacter sp.]|uniref:ABC transporter ATP-binding protein n=1 Tax=Gemmobacter sp. TaxID=1898957 RepID=UPI002AFF7787|nr:ABC transporter ATP-binding protein [Gemmobacter sp.]